MEKVPVKARIPVRVRPRAKVTSLEGKLGEAYKLRLAAPPVDGKANQACIRFFAERFHVPVSAVRILRGQTGRDKVVEIDGVDPAAVERVLNS